MTSNEFAQSIASIGRARAVQISGVIGGTEPATLVGQNSAPTSRHTESTAVISRIGQLGYSTRASKQSAERLARRVALLAFAAAAVMPTSTLHAIPHVPALMQRAVSEAVATPGATLDLAVPVPVAMRGKTGIFLRLRATGLADVRLREVGTMVSTDSAFVHLTVQVPADARAGILDVSDVVFVEPDGAETVVTILLRVAAVPSSAAPAPSAPSFLSRVGNWFSIAHWAVGAEGGFSSAQFAGRNAGFDRDRIGVAGGVFAERAIGAGWSLRSGIGFAQRGGSSATSSSTVGVAINYVEIPVLARYRFQPIKGVTPIGFVGPTFAYYTSCRLRFQGLSSSSSEPCDDGSGVGAPRPRDVALAFGGGVESQLGWAVVDVGVRSLTSLVSMEAPIDVRSSTFTVVVGARMPMSEVPLPWRRGRRAAPSTEAAR